MCPVRVTNFAIICNKLIFRLDLCTIVEKILYLLKYEYIIVKSQLGISFVSNKLKIKRADILNSLELWHWPLV